MSKLRTMNLDSLSHAQRVKLITSFGRTLPLRLWENPTSGLSMWKARTQCHSNLASLVKSSIRISTYSHEQYCYTKILEPCLNIANKQAFTTNTKELNCPSAKPIAAYQYGFAYMSRMSLFLLALLPLVRVKGVLAITIG